jgi:hypothetical protein
MDSKNEIEKKLEHARGYRDALVDTWELVIKLATKGYSSRELQIMSKSHGMEAREQIGAKIAKLEADLAQFDKIDTEDEIKRVGTAEAKLTISVNLKPGMSYMITEPKPSRCYKMFEKEIASGKAGLCVSRSSPTEIRDNYKIGKSMVVWLTSNEKLDTNLPPSALGVMVDDRDAAGANDEYVQPTALHIPYSIILNFLNGNRGGVIVFEGMEYLVSHNKFPSVLNFFQKINEDCKNTNSILIVSVNPSAFEPKQLSQLETEINQVL